MVNTNITWSQIDKVEEEQEDEEACDLAGFNLFLLLIEKDSFWGGHLEDQKS